MTFPTSMLVFPKQFSVRVLSGKTGLGNTLLMLSNTMRPTLTLSKSLKSAASDSTTCTKGGFQLKTVCTFFVRVDLPRSDICTAWEFLTTAPLMGAQLRAPLSLGPVFSTLSGLCPALRVLFQACAFRRCRPSYALSRPRPSAWPRCFLVLHPPP